MCHLDKTGKAGPEVLVDDHVGALGLTLGLGAVRTSSLHTQLDLQEDCTSDEVDKANGEEAVVNMSV